MPAGGRIVWLASYPKSGNTWLRFLLANYLAVDDAPVDINRIDLNSPYPIRQDLLEEECFVDPSLLHLDETNLLRARFMTDFAGRCDTISYVKVHDRHDVGVDGTPLFGRGDTCSAICVVRDPRDVAVSLAFHHDISFDGAIAMLNNPKQRIGRARGRRTRHVAQRIGDWSTHVASWLDQSDLPVHVLRYEDLRADPVGVFAAAIAFVGLERRPGRVERAVRFADFAEMQRQEARSGFFERPSNAGAPFFRSGRAGAWVEALSTAQGDAVTAAHRPTMQRLGYL